ncbi:hypothetical protein [Leifsonella bigeumensis]|uniref:hypothetical protein n=1 Tax=Leifsonella bigeumensis TaxID=433643 RepID=UPI0031DB3CE9
MESDMIIRELEGRANELESEAQRLRAAAEVLRGRSPISSPTRKSLVPARPGTRGGGSMELILTTLDELGPLQNTVLTNELLGRGWKTSSASPSNTVRTALGRLMERGEVRRLKDGRFATASYFTSNAQDE